MRATLLVELLTEELPPKSLAQLGAAFAQGVRDGLVAHRFVAGPGAPQRVLATPRRLAVQVPEALDRAEDRQSEVSGPPVGAPAQAVAGFAKKQGVEVSALEQRDSAKGKVYVAKVSHKGGTLDALLAGIVSEAVRKLPIAKVMRWGDGEAQGPIGLQELGLVVVEKAVTGDRSAALQWLVVTDLDKAAVAIHGGGNLFAEIALLHAVKHFMGDQLFEFAAILVYVSRNFPGALTSLGEVVLLG